MRSDENIQVRSEGGDLGDFGSETPRNSFSGGERDNLFLSDKGEQFYDIAGLAGLDDPGDGRSFSLLDYDRDGWVDLAVASATEPTLQLYKNRIGENFYAGARGAQVVAVRLEGGNRRAAANHGWSPREGYGAIFTITLDDGQELLREARCGDGRAAQNSRTMLIGIGESTSVDLAVRWPSGRRQSFHGITPGTLVTVFENPQHNGGEELRTEPYILNLKRSDAPVPAQRETMALTLPASDTVPSLHLFTAMSTHCKSCKKAQPQVAMLREAFRDGEVGVWGIPVDLEETPDVLGAYVQKSRPAYHVLAHLPMNERKAVKEHITEAFLDEVTPATIITDAEGRILHTMQGLPTVSEVKAYLAR